MSEASNGKRAIAVSDGEHIAEKRQDTTVSKGVAHLKPEYVISSVASCSSSDGAHATVDFDEEPSSERLASSNSAAAGKKMRNKKKQRGQNKNRDNRQVKEENALCSKLIHGEARENCPFGDSCRFNHDLKAYLDSKMPEIDARFFPRGQGCPVWKTLGYCPMGYKCRFLSSHMNAGDSTLVEDKTIALNIDTPLYDINQEINIISYDEKSDLIKKRFDFPKSEEILFIIDSIQQEFRDTVKPQEKKEANENKDKAPQVIQREKELKELRERQKKTYLEYKDTRYFATEKKRLDLRDKKILSPLTTVGNLPYRRLMKKLGCDITYSEMALGVPLIQGTNSEWALPKAHISERGGFGVQIACSKGWQAAKSAEALAKYCGSSGINEINLNSGCPIDLLYRQGSGSALLDNPARLIRCLNGMNYVSGDIPITVKIRNGTKDSHSVADSLVKRLVNETDVAAITLHGRSRQQRYTKLADWEYIKKTGVSLRESEVAFDEKLGENRERVRVEFVGNGDVNNFEDWYKYKAMIPEMDSIMVARGALIKPWIFEEIDAQQYLDKSGTERLEILRDYAQYSMEHWGTDLYGISQCRRFFCDFMSFFHRYIPMGICERYPVKLNERPPHWKGRDDLETLLGSSDSNDWIKLSEMFFGPAEENFHYTPKHKSSSY